MFGSCSAGDRERAAVLGDIVSSREHDADEQLFEAVARSMAFVNERVAAEQPLRFTVGDELQGIYGSAVDAIDASLLLRLHAHPVDIRVGIGVGRIVQTSVAERPYGQTGEGWWLAREALELVEASQRPRRLPALRTALQGGDPDVSRALNALLVVRDELVDRMDATTRRILLGLLLGHQQQAIAGELGVRPSTVSKRISSSGARAVVEAHQRLRAGGTP